MTIIPSLFPVVKPPTWELLAQFEGATLTNVAAALAGYPTATLAPAYRLTIDLRRVISIKFAIAVTTAATASTRAGYQYSIDGGTNWFWLNGIAGTVVDGTVDPVTISAATANVIPAIAAVTLPVAARIQNATVRIATYGGDGVADPVFAHPTLWGLRG